MIELGVPFTDPMADGTKIQATNKVCCVNMLGRWVPFTHDVGSRSARDRFVLCHQACLVVGLQNPQNSEKCRLILSLFR